MVISSKSPSSSSAEISSTESRRRRASSEGRTCRAYETPNFIARNIRAASLVRKIEYDTEESEVASLRSSTNSRKGSRAIFSRGKEDDNGAVDLDYSRGNRVELQEQSAKPAKHSLRCTTTHQRNSSKRQSDDMKTSKYFIKQTTCPACMEKWRKPLPPPKTPKVRSSKVVPVVGNELVKTDSRVRVKELIHREKNTLQTYDRKFSSGSESSKRNSTKKEDLTVDPNDVKLSPLELARIRQEEREKETQKKLEKFLNSPI